MEGPEALRPLSPRRSGICWEVDTEQDLIQTQPSLLKEASSKVPLEPPNARKKDLFKTNKRTTSSLRDRTFLDLISSSEESGVIHEGDKLDEVDDIAFSRLDSKEESEIDPQPDSASANDPSNTTTSLILIHQGPGHCSLHQLTILPPSNHGDLASSEAQANDSGVNWLTILLRQMAGYYGPYPNWDQADTVLPSHFLPKYSSAERQLQIGKMSVDTKIFEAGFSTRIFFRSMRAYPNRSPKIVRYKLHGNHRQFEAYIKAESQHNRERDAWLKMASVLHKSEYNESEISPAFEKLAFDFFNGNPVYEDKYYETAPDISNRRSNHEITYFTGDWTNVLNEVEHRNLLHSQKFCVLLRDLILNDELEKAARKHSLYWGLRVHAQSRVLEEAEKELNAGLNSEQLREALIITVLHANGNIAEEDDHSPNANKFDTIDSVVNSGNDNIIKKKVTSNQPHIPSSDRVMSKSKGVNAGKFENAPWSDNDLDLAKQTVGKKAAKKLTGKDRKVNRNKPKAKQGQHSEHGLLEENKGLAPPDQQASNNVDLPLSQSKAYNTPVIITPSNIPNDTAADHDNEGWNMVQSKSTRKPSGPTANSKKALGFNPRLSTRFGNFIGSISQHRKPAPTPPLIANAPSTPIHNSSHHKQPSPLKREATTARSQEPRAKQCASDQLLNLRHAAVVKKPGSVQQVDMERGKQERVFVLQDYPAIPSKIPNQSMPVKNFSGQGDTATTTASALHMVDSDCPSCDESISNSVTVENVDSPEETTVSVHNEGHGNVEVDSSILQPKPDDTLEFGASETLPANVIGDTGAGQANSSEDGELPFTPDEPAAEITSPLDNPVLPSGSEDAASLVSANELYSQSKFEDNDRKSARNKEDDSNDVDKILRQTEYVANNDPGKKNTIYGSVDESSAKLDKHNVVDPASNHARQPAVEPPARPLTFEDPVAALAQGMETPTIKVSPTDSCPTDSISYQERAPSDSAEACSDGNIVNDGTFDPQSTALSHTSQTTNLGLYNSQHQSNLPAGNEHRYYLNNESNAAATYNLECRYETHDPDHSFQSSRLYGPILSMPALSYFHQPLLIHGHPMPLNYAPQGPDLGNLPINYLPQSGILIFQSGPRMSRPSEPRHPYGHSSDPHPNPSAYISNCTYCNTRVTASLRNPHVMCAGCGPTSNIRYCSIACLLVHSIDHATQCMNWPASQREIYHTLPKIFIYEMDPIVSLDSFAESAEKYRQRAFSMYFYSRSISGLFKAWARKTNYTPIMEDLDVSGSLEQIGDYTVFRSIDLDPAADKNPKCDIIFSINFHRGSALKDALRRSLNACFLIDNPQIVEFLFRLITFLIHDEGFFRIFRYKESSSAIVIKEFERQFDQEFGFNTAMQISPLVTFDFNAEWQAVSPTLSNLESRFPVLNYWFIRQSQEA